MNALLVVDVQNDFADPEGSLYVRDGESVVPFVNELIDAAGAAGEFVVYSQDWHPESTPHFTKDGGIWPVHCVAGSWGAQLHPDLVVSGPTVRKGVGGEDGYSAFTVRDPETGHETATGLTAMLRERSIGRVRIVGLATDYCVAASAIDAAGAAFETIVLADGIRGVDLRPGDSARAVARMIEAGVTVE